MGVHAAERFACACAVGRALSRPHRIVSRPKAEKERARVRMLAKRLGGKRKPW
jgi:hypothetical protein